MPKNILTHIICLDDHRGFTDEVKKRFADTTRYNVITFQTADEISEYFNSQREHAFCKIALLGLHDTPEQYRQIDELASEIGSIDKKTAIILIGPADKASEIKNTFRTHFEAYIPKNTNLILRVHNAVKKIISEHNIRIYKKRRNRSLYALLVFILIALAFIITGYFRFPLYF